MPDNQPDSILSKREFDLDMRELAIEKREFAVQKRELECEMARRECEMAKREDMIRIKTMEDELNERGRGLEDVRRCLEARERDFEFKKEREAHQAQIKESKADLDSQRAQMNTTFDNQRAQIDTILDHHYLLNSEITPLLNENLFNHRDEDNCDGLMTVVVKEKQFGQNGQIITPHTQTLPPPPKSTPITDPEFITPETPFNCELDEITLRGKQIKAISKQIITQHDDLIRKRIDFENEIKQREGELANRIKSAEDDLQVKMKSNQNQINAKWAEVKEKEDEIKTREDQIKIKEDEIKQREQQLVVKPNELATILSQLKPNMFKHYPITNLFGKSINNPDAMKKLKAMVDFKLDVDGAKKMIASPHGHLDPFYDLILTCNKNSQHYGVTDSKVAIEFRCEQLSKQSHINCEHYLDLLRYLFDTGDNKHINPHKPHMISHPSGFTDYWWKSDYDSGKIPKFTPELKLFFKSPNIANNTWIQFHGPGTVLYEIDPEFKLTLGSLCDPNGGGSFRSIDIWDEEHDSDGKYEYNGHLHTSQYQISFKWE